MAGHDAGHSGGRETPAEPWPGGWLWALIAGIVAAILAKWLGDVSAVTAVLIGIFVFLVFGVLLGMFWDSPSPNALGANAGGHHDDHGHGDHDHVHDGHGGHAHESHGAVSTHDHQPVATPAPLVAASAPASAAAPLAAASSGPAKPSGLSAPRGGKGDDLKEIEGIGPALEKLCHELGIFHFDQIAAWGEREIAWMDSNLKGFKGRVTRDRWVAQAKIITTEGLDAFRIRAKTNDY